MEKSIDEIKCQNCKAKAQEELKPIEAKLYELKTNLGPDGHNHPPKPPKHEHMEEDITDKHPHGDNPPPKPHKHEHIDEHITDKHPHGHNHPPKPHKHEHMEEHIINKNNSPKFNDFHEKRKELENLKNSIIEKYKNCSCDLNLS